MLDTAALSSKHKQSLLTLDRAGLQLQAHHSLAAKRRNTPKKARPRLRDRLRALWS